MSIPDLVIRIPPFPLPTARTNAYPTTLGGKAFDTGLVISWLQHDTTDLSVASDVFAASLVKVCKSSSWVY